MKIFCAGIATETNTFSPIPTGLEDFKVRRGRRGCNGSAPAELSLSDVPFLWEQEAKAQGIELVFSLMASAEPAGITVRSTYESLRDEILRDLQATSAVDIVLLNLHGAMIAEAYDDCEQDLITRVRTVVGPEVVIGVLLDLHCHLSEPKIAPADLIITYKEYPHTDVNERAKELFELSLSSRMGRIRPAMALFDCRMIGFYPTSREPLRGVLDTMLESERHGAILSISFGHGFQFADIPHLGAKLLVVADGDLNLAQRTARDWGQRLHALRREIGFERLSLSMEEALRQALAMDRTPVVVADQSDNTGGGAPGDATFVLRWLLAHQVDSVAMAIFYDPEVVKVARKVGVGAQLSVRLGGKTGPSSGTPVDLNVRVLALRDDYVHAFPQQVGEPWLFRAGHMVALRANGIDILVSSERCQCFSPAIFTDFGIDPKQKRLLIAKSYQHFYAAFAKIAAEVIYMAAPGAVPPNPRQIPYTRVDTSRLYPWIENPLLPNR